jgi:hypothetical protein
MAAYGDYRTTCPRHFTHETLQRQYPGNTNQPFEVVGEWGPTPIYKSEGFMVSRGLFLSLSLCPAVACVSSAPARKTRPSRQRQGVVPALPSHVIAPGGENLFIYPTRLDIGA